jgi:hypothetical protein
MAVQDTSGNVRSGPEGFAVSGVRGAVEVVFLALVD